MITKMKKLIFFLPNSANDIDNNLTILGELGVVHISPFQLAKDESIEKIEARIKQFEKAINILDRHPNTSVHESDLEDISNNYTPNEVITLLKKVLNTEKEYQQLKKQKKNLDDNQQWFHNWGNVSLGDISQLKQKNVFLKLYLANDKELKEISNHKNISVAGKLDGLHQIIFISNDRNQKLNLLKIEIPEHEQTEVDQLIEKVNLEINKCERVLATLSSQKTVLISGLEERTRRLDIKTVQFAGQNIDDKIVYWKGFIPEGSVKDLVCTAEKNSWGYIIKDPDQDEIDDVPTQFQTPKWAEKIRPVMNFMGLVPGYKELDVSTVFMLFFTFFTGILVGDAGYGLVFLALTFLIHRKKKFTPIIEFKLMYTLSASIMIWGILTGTFFGSQAIAEISFLRLLRIDKIASFGGDNIFIQKLMFTIGALHLTIGHLQTAWKYNNSVKAIAEIGWTAIVWGLFDIVNQLVLGLNAQAITPYLFIIGISLVALFSNPGTNFLKGIVSSLGNLPLSIINGFSDIISYIRLYAVGLSTVLMAISFNNMAVGNGITTIASGVGAVIILILGHGLNMALSGMAVLVHGVRLNMLEYAGHANVEFSGKEYKPFQIK